MSVLVPIFLFGWIPLVLLLYRLLSPMRATAFAFALGTCFLPVAGYAIPGLPDFTKTFATSIGSLLGVLAFHRELLGLYRPSVLDIPAVILCICPFASSLSNDLGAYDGLSAVVNQTITWGIPYGIGRLVCHSADDLVQLGSVIVLVGVIYIPFCLWEVKMSPLLHYQFFGFHQHSLDQAARGGGWRPMVFMQHGLQLALWMSCCLVLCFSQWLLGRQERVFRSKLTLVLLLLACTFLLLKSTGAYALALLGIGTIAMIRATKTLLPLLLLPTFVLIFLPLRMNELVTGRSLVSLVRAYVSDERAQSLEFRLDNEDRLLAKAKQRWLFGWGGWGRNRIYDQQGRDVTVTDGLWIIELGTHGVIGLVSLYGLLLSGVVMTALLGINLWQRMTAMELANLAGLGVICSLTAIDSIPNAMMIPIFTVAAGALVSIAATAYSTSGAIEPALIIKT